MNEPGADGQRLVFRHTRLGLGALGLLAVLIGSLAWLDRARGEEDLARLREQLCGELPAQLVRGLDALSRDAVRAPAAAREAFSILQGLAEGPEHVHGQARILFESASGFRELKGWSDELGWAHEPRLLEAVRSFRCDAVLEQGQLRAVRPLQTSSGVVVLLVVERRRN